MPDWNPAHFEFDEDEFNGTARLFPLPDLVMFPHVMQPLHVFEPRYRDMVIDALEDDRLIATARLQPGWEGEYDGRPPVAKTACLGKIVSDHELEDGRFNILLLGLRRVHILRESDPLHSYRVADVEVLRDRVCEEERQARREVRGKLLRSFRRSLPIGKGAKEKIGGLLQKHVPLGVLVDLISFTFDLDLSFKQSLLEETDVLRRAQRLLARIEESQPHESGWPKALGEFPPKFSVN